MKKKALYVFSNILIGLSVIFILSSDALAFIVWKGVVLDSETGEPIKGAVIVRSWDRVKATPFGTVNTLIAYKETLSDEDGKFTLTRKLPSISIPILSYLEENTPIVYKPGYKFLVLRDKPQTIELTRIPTIFSLREKELDRASDYIRFDFDYPTNIFLKMIAEERDFLETSEYLIDAQPLIDLLKHGSANRREYAANLLAETVDVRVTDSLIGALDDKNWKVRLEAIDSLGKRKDPRAVKPLIKALTSTTYYTQPEHAAKALVNIGAPAVEELCAVLENPHSIGRFYAAWALGEIGDNRAVEPLLNSLHDEWIRVRWTAAESLGKINEKRSAEALIPVALRDNDRKVRQNAAEALETIGYPGLNVLFAQSQIKTSDAGIHAVLVIDKQLGFGADRIRKHEIVTLKGEELAPTTPATNGLSRSENTHSSRTSEPRLDLAPGVAFEAIMDKIPPIQPKRILRSIVYVAAKSQEENQGAGEFAKLSFGKAKDLKRIRDRFPSLRHTDSFKRLVTVMDLEETQDYRSTPFLIDVLKDENKEVRLAAAVALGRIKHPLAVEYLISVLKDEDAKIRKNAAQALAEMNDTITLVPLVSTMDDLAIGRKTPLVLVRFKDTWIEDQLISGMRDDNSEDRGVLVDVLGKIRSRKAADRIISSVKHYSRGLQASAFNALVQIGEPSIEPLISALQDVDSNMRRSAAFALGRIGDTRAVESLVASLKDEDTNVRWHATSALGKIKDARAIEPLFVSSKKDGQSKVRKQALNALVEMGPLAVERLLQGLKETSSYSRWRAAWALGRLKATEAVEPLIDSLNDEVPEVRWFASVALGEIGDPRAIAPLNILKNDEDLGVRSSAEFSLARFE